LRPDFSNFKKSEETALENSLLFIFTTIYFEDSFTCGYDTTGSVRYHLRANKIDLSLKKLIRVLWSINAIQRAVISVP
jgi:hypothetical protein